MPTPKTFTITFEVPEENYNEINEECLDNTAGNVDIGDLIQNKVANALKEAGLHINYLKVDPDEENILKLPAYNGYEWKETEDGNRESAFPFGLSFEIAHADHEDYGHISFLTGTSLNTGIQVKYDEEGNDYELASLFISLNDLAGQLLDAWENGRLKPKPLEKEDT